MNTQGIIQAQIDRCAREGLPVTQVDQFVYTITIGSTTYTLKLSANYPQEAPKILRGKNDLPCPICQSWNPSFTMFDIINHLRINEGYDTAYNTQKCKLDVEEVKAAISRAGINQVSIASGREAVINQCKSVRQAKDKMKAVNDRKRAAETRLGTVFNELFELKEEVDNLQKNRESLQGEAAKCSKDPQQISKESMKAKIASLKEDNKVITVELESLRTALASQQIKPEQFALDYKAKLQLKLKNKKLIESLK